MSTTRPKAVYAFFYAAMACLVPFMTLYYQHQGMSGAQIGVLSGLIPLLSMGSSALWSGIADATRRHRGVLLLAIGGLCLSVVVLWFADSFALLLVAVVTYAFFVGPVVPLVDNAVLNILGTQRASYGRVRVWGAVGWGLAALALAPLLQRAGWTWSFAAFWLFMGICFLVAMRLPMANLDVRGDGPPVAYRKGLALLLSRGRFLLLLFVSLVFGVGLGVLLSYQFIFLEQLGASRSLMSLTLSAATLSEIPFWFLSGALLARFGSSRLIAIALAATGIRYLGMALLTNPWLALPLNMMHGPSFAVLWAAGVAEADAAAPSGLGATAQGLFSAMIFGLGSALGGFLGGPAYEAIGFDQLWLILGWMTLAALAIFVVARLGARRRVAVTGE